MKNEKDMNIGIFGGTFNPPHNAHISIAEQTVRQFKLDKIYFIPAYIPPHKSNSLSVSAKHRLKMLKLAIGKDKHFQVSSIELKRRGVSYTIDTLRYFKRKYPSSKLFLIIGSDNLSIFNKWKSYKSILKMAELLVYRRKGYSHVTRSSRINFCLIRGAIINLSSTKIRNLVKSNKSIKGLVPKDVEKYIKANLIYKS